MSNISFEFNRLKTQENTDIISIYDGPTTSDVLLGVFSGTSTPQQFESTGNVVLVTFESDNENTDEGWFLSYTSISPVWCNGLQNLTEPIDTIDDGSGAFYYQNNATCMWYIQPEAATTITLTFMEFDTEEDVDLVKIYDASTNTLLETWSGNEIPPQLIVETDKIMIAFSTNATGTNLGWKAWYTVDDVSVNESSLHLNKVRIFPNPAKHILHLSFNQDQISESTIEIKSLTGQILRTEIISANIKDYSINIDGISSGVYLVAIRNRNFVVNQKIIIKP